MQLAFFLPNFRDGGLFCMPFDDYYKNMTGWGLWGPGSNPDSEYIGPPGRWYYKHGRHEGECSIGGQPLEAGYYGPRWCHGGRAGCEVLEGV